jgi:phage FluMu protein Com
MWVVDYHRWSRQLLCNIGGLIYMEVEGDLEVYDYVGDVPGLKGNPARHTPPVPSPDDYFRCADCNRLTLKTGKHHLYCPACSDFRRRERKRKWIQQRRKSAKQAETAGQKTV